MAQQYVWPAISVTATNPSVGLTGAAAPTSATEVAGVGPGNILTALTVDASGGLVSTDAADGPVTPGTVASKSALAGLQFNTVLPTLTNGQQAAAQADSSGRQIIAPLTNSSIVKAQLQDNAGTAVTVGQKAMAASLPVVIASDQSAVPVSAASLPLPTGASTSALQTQISAQLPTTLGAHVTAASLAVNIASDQVVPVSASALPLPTGAATSANQATEITSLASIATNTTGLNATIAAKGAASPADVVQVGVVTAGNVNPITTGSTTSANSIPVVIASDQANVPTKLAGKSAVTFVRNDYSSVNVTTAAYVQLIASTPSAASEIFIFDSSGQTLKLAFGGAGVEVDQMLIVPGGNGEVPLAVPASTRVSIKAVSATANVGEIDINLYG